MDARLVWDTWRRILTDDELVERVLEPEGSGADGRTGLSPRELAVLADYASTPVATATNIGMYRRGLVRNALGALSLVRLTRHLFYMSTPDPEAVAENFVRSIAYVDQGPNFWRTAGDFVAYLAGLPEFAGRVQQEVLTLDAETIALARQLGRSPVETWPDDAATSVSNVARGDARFAASRAAVVASSIYDLTPWIVDPEGFDPDDQLEGVTRYWLVYFPAGEAEHAYAGLSERTARTFDLLSAPKTASEVSLALDGLSRTDVLDVIDSLAELGVIIIEEDA